MTDAELADKLHHWVNFGSAEKLSPEEWKQIIAALRRSQSDCSFRVFKLCLEHKDVTQWTVHPTGYAIPVIEVCPVCEEIAYNKRLVAEGHP